MPQKEDHETAFKLIASPILERFWVNVPHMKALVARIPKLILLLEYDYRWLKYRLKLLRSGFLRSFAPCGPELEPVGAQPRNWMEKVAEMDIYNIGFEGNFVSQPV